MEIHYLCVEPSVVHESTDEITKAIHDTENFTLSLRNHSKQRDANHLAKTKLARKH